MSRTEASLGRITPQERRALVSGTIGNSIEYYEFAVYGLAAALVFKDIFFPGFSAAAGTLLSMATFAIAFVARPIGAVVFGNYGDKLGRKKMLIISLSMMGVSTVCIGLLPTFDQIGIAAPFLLVSLRLIQGFSLGGEYSGAILMSLEHAYPGRRGLFGALIHSGIGWGTLMANAAFLVVTQLPDDQFLSWGWRIPFVVSAALVLVCMFIRLRLDESPEFEVVRETNSVAKLPIAELLRTHGWSVLGVALMIPGSGTLYYLAQVFSLTYAGSEGIDKGSVLTAVLLVNIVLIVGMPLWGWLGDVTSGRRTILLTSYVGMAVATWIWFPLLNTGVTALIIVGFIILFIPHTANNASLPSTFAHVFPAEVRYSGMALGYNAGTLIGSALAPIIASTLLSSTGSWIWIAMYMSVANVISLIAALLIRERYVNVAQTPTIAASEVKVQGAVAGD